MTSRVTIKWNGTWAMAQECSLEGSVCGLSGSITFKPGTWLNFPHMGTKRDDLAVSGKDVRAVKLF